MNLNDWRGVLANEYVDEPELLDRPDEATPDEIAGSMRPLAAVNRFLGGRRVLLRHAMPLIRRAVAERETDDPIRLLDIGTGGGDLPRALSARLERERLPATIEGIDLNRDIVRFAREQSAGYREISFRVADIYSLEKEREIYDVVLASLFLHHFDPEHVVHLMMLMGRLARTGFVVNDLVRHPLAYLGISALSAFSTNRVFRHDARASVRRSFTIDEWAELAERTGLPGLELTPHFPFRVALTWRRTSRAPEARRRKDRQEQETASYP